MLRHVRRLACVVSVAIAGLALAAPVQADMTVMITDTNVTGMVVTQVDSITLHDTGTGNIAFSPASFGNYSSISLSISANYDNNTGGNSNTGDANVLDIALSTTRNGTGGTDTLSIVVTTTNTAGWTVPAGNPLLLSGTLSVTKIGSGPVSFGSTLLDTGGTPSTSVNVTGGAVNTFYNSVLAGNPTPPFFLNNSLSITTSSNNRIDLSASTDAVIPSPEASSMVLAGIGALGMIGYGLRRKVRGA